MTLAADANLLVIAAIVLAAVGLVLAIKALRHQLIPRNFGVVEPGRIFRSGRLNPRTLRLVGRRHRISTIIDLHAFSDDPRADRAIARESERLGLNRIVIKGALGNATGNPNVYLHALRLMGRQEHHPILIHCAAGAERTGAAVMLFRHLIQGRPIDEAHAEARQFGHDPRKNKELLAYVQQHVAAIRSALESGTVVPGFPDPEIAATLAKDHPGTSAPAPEGAP